MGMLVGKNHLGFGNRSWRYMCVINNGVVESGGKNTGINNEGTDDDIHRKHTNNMLEYLKSSKFRSWYV